MIPSIIDHQLREGVRDYLRTTFPVTTKLFADSVEELLNDEGRMFKGPYVGLGLPFVQGASGPDVFPDIPLRFPPFVHQEQAFARLRGDGARATVVATGTGSGKTECFLLPILEYCLQRRRERESGIKAILIYPMNALAQDQAKRIAQTVSRTDALRGEITAGLYVGGEQKAPHQAMGADHIITDRETIRLRPPDILLTNYKMLDYMLSRPRDKGVWSQNGPGVLRYLVVDELHTFDGAQGTDLALLVRRLKHRLGSTGGRLCCVGTSATLGGGGDAAGDLLDYARKVFGEDFDEDAVIGESREDYRTFLHGSFLARSYAIPGADDLQDMLPDAYEFPDDYVRAQARLWFGKNMPEADELTVEWKCALGDELKRHPLLRTLLEVLDGKTVAEGVLLRHLRGTFEEFAGGEDDYHRVLLQSLLAIVSVARRRNPVSDTPPTVPFVHVRYQSWVRELRRMVSSVGDTPHLEFAVDLTESELARHLPVVHCRECGSTGWAGIKKANEDRVDTDLRTFYSGYFDRASPHVCYLFPSTSDLPEGEDVGYYASLCPSCLRLSPGGPKPCSDCGSRGVGVYVPYNVSGGQGRLRSRHNCPVCRSRDSLVLFGARSASLSSVMINQLFASPYNDDKKLVAFSDNVQDASHRAGFYGARTWRFNFRAALQQCLESLDDEPTLAEVPERFERYWKSQVPIEDYVATFLPPDLAWYDEFTGLLENRQPSFSGAFLGDLGKRLSWEVYSEYGLNSRVGRTLEKAGCSVTRVELPVGKESVGDLRMRLENRVGVLRGKLDDDVLRRFAAGFAKRLVVRGAFYQEVLSSYIEKPGDIYYVNSRHWMRRFGYGTPSPGFPATESGKESRLERLATRPDRPTSWFAHWLLKHFGGTVEVLSYFDDIYREFFDWLVRDGVLNEHISGDNTVWSLDPSRVRISREVEQYRCDECGHRVAAARSEASSWEGMACLKQTCRGSYRSIGVTNDYYTHLYKRGDIQRLFPREHTGLLSREDREPLEAQFKTPRNERRTWYPNLLSCTPTLEMGIDIGDLSSVLLCSVPPEQASYLQRIGRAGRADGNATNTTIATAKPHDLYFFAQPDEMMQGAVKTPGVYLDASAVLERQVTAFCLDQWVREVAGASVPNTMQPILAKVSRNSAQGFPYDFLAYVSENRDRLESDFLALCEPFLGSSTKDHIHGFLHASENDPGIERKLVNGLRNLLDERVSLERQRNALSARAQKMKADPGHDPDLLDDVELELQAFRQLITKINTKNTFEFLTSEGLIPNYAFPEAGVQLQSIIYRRNREDNERKSLKTVYEYERAAASAITDLVPGNTFYAHGRKVEIDQVNLALSKPEPWRFCPECTHSQLDNEATNVRTCPMCGSNMWSDAQQKHRMLKVRQVIATTSARMGLVTDDAEDREIRYFRRYMYFGCRKEDVLEAWQIDDEQAPFGFEVLRSARFHEINFGEPDTNGVDIRVAGRDIDATGFRICTRCGKLQKPFGEAEHSFGCPARGSAEDVDYAETLFLYRDFHSEAVRFFIPSIMEFTERKLHSFLAALMLGLTRFYRGDVAHLRTCLHDEPIDGSKLRRRYVVLFDTVPGGTGYLKQFAANPGVVFDILQQALHRLNSCTCNQTDRDGCYGCLYAYRNSFDMPHISRETAKELLGGLVSNRKHLSRISSVSEIRVNALLESELERRLMGHLEQYARRASDASFTQATIGTKAGYRLEIGDETWEIEPQVELGPDQGVAVSSRVDFVFRNTSGKALPIAVFTDGYRYHCDRLATDTAQRLALVQSGGYLVWSLTWDDVESLASGVRDAPGTNSLHIKGDLSKRFDEACDKFGIGSMKKRIDENSMAWLMAYLREPVYGQWRGFARLHGTFRLDPTAQGEDADNAWLAQVSVQLPPHLSERVATVSQPRLVGTQSLSDVSTLSVAVTRAQTGDGVAAAAALSIDDTSSVGEAEWAEFLQWANLIQFLPVGFAVSHKGAENSAYGAIPVAKRSPEDAAPPASAWDDIEELVSDAVRPLLRDIADASDVVPDVGYELMEGDEVTAEAELAWEGTHTALLWTQEDADAFKAAGWEAYLVGAVIAAPGSFLEHLTRSSS